MNSKTIRAIEKYGKAACERAYQLSQVGEGAASILHGFTLPGADLRTVGQVDAAINAGRELAAGGYTHQVNFEKVFVEGPLKGLRYHDHLRFTSRSDALFFARRDGYIVTPAGGSGYRQEASVVVDLREFEQRGQVRS